MPLSSTAARKPIHARQIRFEGYRRDDGLWDIEAYLLDTKAYDFTRRQGATIHPAGQPVHEMFVRLTVDDGLDIHDIEVAMDAVPFSTCSDIQIAFSSLRGLNLGAGFVKELRQRFGGTRGCNHLVDLLIGMATAAFQTIYPVLSRERNDGTRPAIIGMCHALAPDGEIVAAVWPQHHVSGQEEAKGS